VQLSRTLLLLLAFGAAPVAGEGGRLAERVANGTLDFGHPAVAALRGPAGTACSAVLVGCRTALTAAHCFCEDPATGQPFSAAECAARPELLAPAGWSLFFQHGGELPLAKIDIAPDYAFGTRSDLAVLHLAGPVEGVTPLPLRTGATPAAGSSATVVGFGRAAGADDRGLKRSGRVTLGACSAVPSTGNLCWDFAEPLPPAGDAANACDGDGGGPLLLDEAGVSTVGGIVSGGTSPSCQPPDQSWASDVATDATWIAAQAGADLGATSCGGLTPVGTAGATVAFASGDLSGSTPELRSSLVVPAGTARLRVAVHGDEVGRIATFTDFDLYLQTPGLPSPTSWTCRSAGASVYELCDVVAPAAGTWNVLLSRDTGAGAYQIVATRFDKVVSTCTAGETTLCIDDATADQRFKVQVDFYSTRNGGFVGQGRAIGLASLGVTRGGLFWFFDAGNPELLVKVLNGCGINDRYWVYLTAGTDVGYTVLVTDTRTGISRLYRNTDGIPAPPVQDVDALPCH
jgi:hypothetical protein